MTSIDVKSRQRKDKKAALDVIDIEGVPFLKISDADTMPPFLMSVVSNSDHWMFIASNGGMTAGRKNAQYSIFPYYTDDKLIDLADISGSKTIFQLETPEGVEVWEPFSNRFLGKYDLSVHLYKSAYGNQIIFEEVNRDLGLTFQYRWSSSDEFGFVKTSQLRNWGNTVQAVRLLDGIQNIIPFGVSSDLQQTSSNLVDAYKQSELHEESKMGIFSLSAIIVDKAEPSEALKTNVAWSVGLDEPTILLSSNQIDEFRHGGAVVSESDIKGEKGAYFVSKEIIVESGSHCEWRILADVNKNHSQVIHLAQQIKNDAHLNLRISEDIRKGTKELVRLVASSDGIQHTADTLQDCRHFSNVLFNIMRGGVADKGYCVEKSDFVPYLKKANRKLSLKQQKFIDALPASISYMDLIGKVRSTKDPDFIRLAVEYLPLKFSRRHGDPSRPWNEFSINIRDEKDGSKVLDYEGNWRDLFQNWEALSYSFPEFLEGMIYKFLNASTFDGYNPYRITKDGFDWETIEPDDPWSYIGYWGDHQIIYLLKFLELLDQFRPGQLQRLLEKEEFVYAAVPYEIKPYDEIIDNPKDTIHFNRDLDKKIRARRDEMGGDGALLRNSFGEINKVNFIEKLLVTLMAKLSNFVPQGGIWMNTQRPEWNDANNALVGNGVSMVTLYYVYRFLLFIEKVLEGCDANRISLSNEFVEFYHTVREVFETHIEAIDHGFDESVRKEIVDELGKAASDYRIHIYKSGFWGKKRTVSMAGVKRLISLSLRYLKNSIEENKREDGLYHAYNLLSIEENGVNLYHLDEMLEGQVAVLSSGFVNGEEALEVLDAMRKSALFRPDQYSYILYPNKKLPGFLERNVIPREIAEKSEFIQQLIADGNSSLVEQDALGHYHFNGRFKNAADLREALDDLVEEKKYEEQVRSFYQEILDIFEQVFNHKAFTGRSGTFYAYEGLGSIYWHMVSKLLLASQEGCLEAIRREEDPVWIGRLLDHYYEIQAGIGVHKSPELYGAFPTDPYSHTPMHRGAQQPGMTGQVKEDIIVRIKELGVFHDQGELRFAPCLLKVEEFLTKSIQFTFLDVNGNDLSMEVDEGQLFFSYCQVPVIYTKSNASKILISCFDESKHEIAGNTLPKKWSESIFQREGKIRQLTIYVDHQILK